MYYYLQNHKNYIVVFKSTFNSTLQISLYYTGGQSVIKCNVTYTYSTTVLVYSYISIYFYVLFHMLYPVMLYPVMLYQYYTLTVIAIITNTYVI